MGERFPTAVSTQNESGRAAPTCQVFVLFAPRVKPLSRDTYRPRVCSTRVRDSCEPESGERVLLFAASPVESDGDDTGRVIQARLAELVLALSSPQRGA